ncbi:ribonuclease H-like domain-containing protein, partial [Tanacetum coccineum]
VRVTKPQNKTPYELLFGHKPILLNTLSPLGKFDEKSDEGFLIGYSVNSKAFRTIRNKARLVAQGHRQEEGIDYDEVFALVARIEAIRLFLAFASFMGFIVYQMDAEY